MALASPRPSVGPSPAASVSAADFELRLASVARKCAAKARLEFAAYKKEAASALKQALAQRDEVIGRLEECWRELQRELRRAEGAAGGGPGERLRRWLCGL